MDSLTRQLFPDFPREIAFPWRKTVYSLSEFKKEIQNNNGIIDIYTSIYASNFLINKIFFDLDYGPNVLKDAQKIVSWCLDKGYQTIPIISGKKGYHVYVIVKPSLHKEKSKLKLLTAHYSIIQSVFGNFKQQMYTQPDGKTVSVLRNSKRIIGPDPAICGDVRRIARVPNTLRPPENINYCTYINPEKFLSATQEEMMVHVKSTHIYDTEIDYRHAPKIEEFEYTFEKEPDFSDWTIIESGTPAKIGNPSKYLQGLLRPCLYRHMITIHPSDMVRFASTLDLLSFTDLTPSEITAIYSSLGWEDFVEQKTYKKILLIAKKVHNGTYSSWKCSKLISLNIPRICCVE